mgnify:CR=1 FL=1
MAMLKKDNKVRIVLFSLDDPIISFPFLFHMLKNDNLDINMVIIPQGFFQISRLFKIFLMFFVSIFVVEKAIEKINI